MSELIRHKQDLIEYLTTKRIASKKPPEHVNVTSSLRKSVLTDEMQGFFIHKGQHREFEFKSLGGGVYQAKIKEKGIGVIGGGV